MEQIITLILFLFPGVFISLLYKKYLPISKEELSDYENIAIAFLYSFSVLIINFVIIKKVFNRDISTLSELMSNFARITFLLKYVSLTILTGSIFAILWHCIARRVLLCISNLIRHKRGLAKQTKFPSVWSEIFENPDNSMDDAYIAIEKDGEIITQGLIEIYSPSNSETKEVKLICTDTFKLYLKNDESLPDDQKIFDDIMYEYYNFDTGVLIKFYNNEKLKKYLEEDNATLP